MASIQPGDADNLDKIIDSKIELENQATVYRELAKLAGSIDATTKSTLKSYTSINTTVESVADEISRIAAGKEKIQRLNNLEKVVSGKIALNATELNKIIKDTGHTVKGVTDEYNNLNSEIEKIAAAQIQNEKDLNDAALAGFSVQSAVYQALVNKKITLDQQRADKQKDLTAFAQDADKFRLLILNKQNEELNKTVTLVNQYVAAARKESAFKSPYWKELAKKIFPGLSKNIGGMADGITKFGMRAGLAMAAFTGIAMAAKAIVDAMFSADQDATDLSRSMTISKEQSFQMLTNFEAISNQIDNSLYSSKDILKSQLAINNALGTSMFLRAEDLKTLTKMMDTMGLSEESAGQLAKFSFASGKNFETIKNEIYGTSKIAQIQSGIFLNDKKILETVLATTGRIRANFKGQTKDITAAVVQAKLLGTTLEQVDKVAESLLDFESSISSELEAELLTGKKFNLEIARSAALIGDMKTVMEEMNKQGMSFGEFTKMNVIQQNKVAQMIGLTRDEYADMAFEQMALNKMRAAGQKNEQEDLITRYNNLKREGRDVVNLLGDVVASRLEQQSAQEKFNKIVEKLMTVLERIVQNGILDKLIIKLANVAKYFSEGGSILGGMIGGFTPDQEYTAESLGIAQKVQDSVISPSGNITISTPKGKIVPHKDDSIITTTNPKGLLAGNNTGNMEAKLDTMIMLLRQGKSLYMDSIKVGTSQGMSQNNYA